jgi:hypothetical protein
MAVVNAEALRGALVATAMAAIIANENFILSFR